MMNKREKEEGFGCWFLASRRIPGGPGGGGKKGELYMSRREEGREGKCGCNECVCFHKCGDCVKMLSLKRGKINLGL